MEESSKSIVDSSEFPQNFVPNFTDFQREKGPRCNDISHELVELVNFIINMCINSVLCYSGAVSNVVTIVIFSKLGFLNTINISLTSIAFWDFMKCMCGIINKLHGPMSYFDYYFSVNWRVATLYVAGNSFVLFRYCSSGLTAYVALERCLCVLFPFTVKYLLTQRLVIFVNVLVPLLVLVFNCHIFTMYRLGSVFNPYFNRSMTSFVYTWSGLYSSIRRYNQLMLILSPTVSWSIMTICTILIAIGLRKASKVRSRMKQRPEEVNKYSHLSSRDRQVIKMLLAGITVTIVAFIPQIITTSLTLTFSELYGGGCLGNYFRITTIIVTCAEYLNAIANPIIFFFMSSAFKAAFLNMFKRKKK